MANFRNTADYVTSILQLAGEPTTSSGSYYGKALEHLNSIHRTIIMGGSEFNVEVDELWPWARSRHPLNIELLPPVTGTVTVTKGATSLTFANTPVDEDSNNISLDKYFIRLGDKQATYKITEHTSGTTSANINTKVAEASGTYTFTAFKLDYELATEHVIVDDLNNLIYFSETNASTLLLASVTEGTYTLDDFGTALTTALNASGASTYSSVFSASTGKFLISSNLAGADGVFKIMGGAESVAATIKSRSLLPLIGYSLQDYTGAATYTADNIITPIAKLVQPFKMHTQSRSHLIDGLDPIEFDADFPVMHTKQDLPHKFCVRRHTDEGRLWVRFNSYTSERKTIAIEYVPLPTDLHNNAVSYPLFPHQYSKILEYGAASYLLSEKEDTKAQEYFNKAAQLLQAMMSNNRKTDKRLNSKFGHIVARPELANITSRALNYGYTSEDY